jgi:hypothetical protein
VDCSRQNKESHDMVGHGTFIASQYIQENKRVLLSIYKVYHLDGEGVGDALLECI